MTWTPIAAATCKITDCLPGTSIPMATLATTLIGSASPTSVPSLVKRTMPYPWQWGSIDEFLISEYDVAEEVERTGTEPRWPESGTTSATYKELGTSQFNLLLAGLWGCTSVVVMSQKAIWMSHIWESPAPQSETQIESDVVDAMVFGTSDVLNLLDLEVKDSFYLKLTLGCIL